MASPFLGRVSDKLVAASLSAALGRTVVTHEEYEERKSEPKFACVGTCTLDIPKFAELSYAPAYGKFGDIYHESGRKKITVYVQTITGRIFELKIGCDSYVEVVKHVIDDSHGAHVDHDRLILLFNGKILDDRRRLSDYRVSDSDCITSGHL